MVLEWHSGDKPEQACYYLDGRPMGAGDDGFDRVLEAVGGIEPNSTLVIRFPLELGQGGEPFGSTFPFARRRSELDRLTTGRRVRVVYELRQS